MSLFDSGHAAVCLITSRSLNNGRVYYVGTCGHKQGAIIRQNGDDDHRGCSIQATRRMAAGGDLVGVEGPGLVEHAVRLSPRRSEVTCRRERGAALGVGRWVVAGRSPTVTSDGPL